MVEIIYEKENYKIIRAYISVHEELGCGFLEVDYQEALAIEFRNDGIPFEQEKSLKYKRLVL